MLVAIIGGNLQGVEATYLAKKAGWEVLLIDKNPRAAASLMCDRFLPLQITTKGDLDQIPDQVELVIPALENNGVLRILTDWSSQSGIPLAFDMGAYAISSSKKKSNQLFNEIYVNTPKSWPQCNFPIVIKPDGESGSRGVKIIHNEKELTSTFPAEHSPDDIVAQEYLEGPYYSIEIIGHPGNYAPMQVTQLHMDRDHDCKRVLAPSGLDSAQVMEFEQMAIRVAERIQLRGLMDMEVILHDDQLKVLEIDARLPSQTPTTVFHSTGVNMVDLLAELFLSGNVKINQMKETQTTIYEHIKVVKDHIEVMGEHIMAGAGPLKSYRGLFGTEEVITNFHPDLDEWVATLIFKGNNMEEVLGSKQQTYENIHNRIGQVDEDI
jgi:pyrrolysine biosynthesis protein PylC